MIRIHLLGLLILVGCSQEVKKDSTENEPIELSEEQENRLKWQQERDVQLKLEKELNRKLIKVSTDSLWNYLAFVKGGCLTGGQYVNKGKFGGEGCVMSRKEEWDIFTNRNKDSLTHFLLSKLPSMDTTEIHACPFFVSTEGELAVYTLQKLHRINWFDLEGFEKYKGRQTTSSDDCAQSWLQEILSNKKQRKIMSEAWREERNKIN